MVAKFRSIIPISEQQMIREPYDYTKDEFEDIDAQM
jgi:hypothetical protein